VLHIISEHHNVGFLEPKPVDEHVLEALRVIDAPAAAAIVYNERHKSLDLVTFASSGLRSSCLPPICCSILLFIWLIYSLRPARVYM
jgi:hypothetical protein